MSKYPILQSGFINFTDENLKTPVKYNDLVISNVLSKDYRSPSNRYFYSAEISELYNLWCGNPNCLKDFDIREQLLHITKLLFGQHSFFKWLRLQTEHADLSDLHKTFLIETLEYLVGQPRRLETAQWIKLLEKAIKSEGVKINIERFFDKELYHSVDPLSLLPSTLIDILVIWTSKPRGFEDLLLTLYVIFGNRPYITDVSENPRS